MKGKLKKVLVAVDGSDQSMNAVRYASEILSPKQNKVVVFYVETEVPETFLDLEKSPEFRSKIIPIRAWIAQQKKVLAEFMGKAKKIFTAAGFSSEAVQVNIHAKKTGVARDILHESSEGYDAVIVGRTGVSKLKDIFIGSVATKLIGRMHEIPLVVVGGKPGVHKIIVGFDGSEGSKKSVNCMGAVVGRPDCEILLCHVIRPLHIVHEAYSRIFSTEDELSWLEENEKNIKPEIDKAREVLVEMGFQSDMIKSKIISDNVSRAVSIVEEAKSGGYGSIVVGRRGLSIVQEFFMGRVSKKILNLAADKAVWIVS